MNRDWRVLMMVRQTNRQTNKQTDIDDYRVAFATDNMTDYKSCCAV